MGLVIGINGGHTKSVACVLNEDDRGLMVVSGLSLNMHTYPYQEVESRFQDLLDRLACKMDLRLNDLVTNVRKIVLSMPGAGSPEDISLIRACLLEPRWDTSDRYGVLDDTWAGLISGTFQSTGVCVFVGTGASVYVGDVEDHEPAFFGKPNKIDGWGPIIGDFGSGFQLVVDMFRLFNREYDRGNWYDIALFHRVTEQEPMLSDLGKVQRWFDGLYIRHPHDWRIRFAHLASVVTAAADEVKPDKHAVKLIREAARGAVESVEIAISRFPETSHLPIVLQGGMFEHSRLFRRLVSDSVARIAKGPVYMARFRPVVGALIIALGDRRILSDRGFLLDLCHKIDQLSKKDQELLVRWEGSSPSGYEVLNDEKA